jgi:hypothetical protein
MMVAHSIPTWKQLNKVQNVEVSDTTKGDESVPSWFKKKLLITQAGALRSEEF